ncbi:polyketide cyclase/dehydrase/lipid transport protein [Haloactinopolyspora alba]|uniref:Polyketide cyclase/dehydrase/lipid transport protein n=1 Tax=Haloactinopolyspora alba TaxID=648780 RepID=A0A2P8EC15_9ACTN|nr:SRPBCC family protein [Haloactinopolyspora alba]PSL07006.1 polyketide cyclase/dehydrase/lipid transport protein [Haloactinopolyspora alba]
MAVQDIDVSATTAASPHTVHALLVDGATWPTWSPLGSFELERPADDGSEGAGAIRIFRTGRLRNRERIVECVPGRRLSYVLLEGMAVRGYRADIDLTETADGTRIRWHSTFRAKMPGMGGVYRRSLTTFLQRSVDGLAERAAALEGRAAGNG